jgi:DNA-binding NtrC family response regulator
VENEIENATVLAILPAHEDRLSLSAAFAGSGWISVFTGNIEEALAVLESVRVGVVVCDVRLPGGHSWRDLINEMLQMQAPPPLILADRLADNRLWVETLNLGVYDLLAKPFDSKEVLRAVTMACRRQEHRSGLVRDGKESGSGDSKEAARGMSASL